MGSIYLIRHGQASFGAENYDVLSPLGYRQSEALGDYLAQLDVTFDRCLSGELERQQDTARTTTGGLQTDADWTCIPTLVQRGASIGSNLR